MGGGHRAFFLLFPPEDYTDSSLKTGFKRVLLNPRTHDTPRPSSENEHELNMNTSSRMPLPCPALPPTTQNAVFSLTPINQTNLSFQLFYFNILSFILNNSSSHPPLILVQYWLNKCGGLKYQ